MNAVAYCLHAVRELGLVRFKPVTDCRFPAVIDLEQVTLDEYLLTALKIFQNAVFTDVFIAVVPA